jgi:hypothetical protein
MTERFPLHNSDKRQRCFTEGRWFYKARIRAHRTERVRISFIWLLTLGGKITYSHSKTNRMENIWTKRRNSEPGGNFITRHVWIEIMFSVGMCTKIYSYNFPPNGKNIIGKRRDTISESKDITYVDNGGNNIFSNFWAHTFFRVIILWRPRLS